MPAASPVRVAATTDGIPVYLVDGPPEALPPVRRRDLQAAWEAARAAAITARWGAARMFRFRRAGGVHTDLALADPDACCWAGAVDSTVGMDSPYGLSLCLRLLALVDLLGRAAWAAPLFAIGRDGADLHPSLLRTAATCPLSSEGRFDESRFRAAVRAEWPPGLPAPVPSQAPYLAAEAAA